MKSFREMSLQAEAFGWFGKKDQSSKLTGNNARQAMRPELVVQERVYHRTMRQFMYSVEYFNEYYIKPTYEMADRVRISQGMFDAVAEAFDAFTQEVIRVGKMCLAEWDEMVRAGSRGAQSPDKGSVGPPSYFGPYIMSSSRPEAYTVANAVNSVQQVLFGTGAPGNLEGTLSYMSPEQIGNESRDYFQEEVRAAMMMLRSASSDKIRREADGVGHAWDRFAQAWDEMSKTMDERFAGQFSTRKKPKAGWKPGPLRPSRLATGEVSPRDPSHIQPADWGPMQQAGEQPQNTVVPQPQPPVDQPAVINRRRRS